MCIFIRSVQTDKKLYIFLEGPNLTRPPGLKTCEQKIWEALFKAGRQKAAEETFTMVLSDQAKSFLNLKSGQAPSTILALYGELNYLTSLPDLKRLKKKILNALLRNFE